MSNQNEKIVEALAAIHGLMGAKMELVNQVKADIQGATDEQKTLALVFAKELPYLDAVLGVLMDAVGMEDERVPNGATIQ